MFVFSGLAILCDQVTSGQQFIITRIVAAFWIVILRTSNQSREMVSAEPELADLVSAEEAEYIGSIDLIKSLTHDIVESLDKQRERRHAIAK